MADREGVRGAVLHQTTFREPFEYGAVVMTANASASYPFYLPRR